MKKNKHDFFKRILPAAFAMSGMLCNLLPVYANDQTIDIGKGSTVTYTDSNGETHTIEMGNGGSINVNGEESSVANSDKQKNKENTNSYRGPRNSTPTVTYSDILKQKLNESSVNLSEDKNIVSQAEELIYSQLKDLYKNSEVSKNKLTISKHLKSKDKNVLSDGVEVGEVETAVGDPVLISSGNYMNYQIDDSMYYGLNNFIIDRCHVSSEKDEGAFGYAWTSSLDTRIIRGSSEALEMLYNSYQKKYDTVVDELKKITSDSSKKPNLALVNLCVQKRDEIASAMNKIKADYEYSMNTRNLNMYSFTERYASMKKAGIDTILFIDENGSAILMNYDSRDKCFYPADENLTKSVNIKFEKDNRNLGFIVNYANGNVWKFNNYGRPVSKTNLHGSKITFSYAGEKNQITSIERDGTNVINLKWKNNLITEIKDLIDGSFHRYSYEAGFLTKVENKSGDFVMYFYDASQNIEKIVNTDYTKVFIDYSTTEDGIVRAASTTNENGNSEFFDWNDEENVMVYTNADGEKTYYYFDENHNIVKKENCLGFTVEWLYDERGRVLSVTDGYGCKKYSYLENGLTGEISFDDGSREVYEYDEHEQLIRFVNRDKNVTEYIRDSKGNIIKILCDGRQIAKASYEDWGGMRLYEGLGGKKEFSYDDNFNISYDGKKRYVYDSNNKLVTETDYNGETVTYEYSEKERKVKISYPSGLIKIFEKDNKGNLVKIVQSDSNTGLTYLTVNVFDRENRLVEVYLGEGKSESQAQKNLYLAESNAYTNTDKLLLHVKWNHGAAKTNDCDGLANCYLWKDNKIVKTSSFFVDYRGKTSGNEVSLTMNYSFENGCLCIEKTDSCGNKSYSYSNESGLLLKTVDSNGAEKIKLYSPAGKLLSESGDFGSIYNYEWDNAVNKIAKVYDDSGNLLSEIEFNQEGNIILERKTGALDVHYNYSLSDYDMTLVKSSDLGTESCVMDLNCNPYNYTVFDQHGRAVSSVRYSYSDHGKSVLIDDNSKRICRNYDAWGRLIYDSEKEEKYSYDIFNRIVSISSRNDMVNVSYEYNVGNKISRISVKGGNVTDYSYNPQGALLSVIDRAGLVWSGEYDAAGKLLNEKGRQIPDMSYVYDKAGNICEVYEGKDLVEKISVSDDMTEKLIIDGNSNSISCLYDKKGRLVSHKDRLGYEKIYAYDDVLGLETVKSFDGSEVEYKYDLFNSTLTKNYSDQKKTEFGFNNSGKLVYVNNDEEKLSFVYNENGDLKKIENAKENSILYKYDSKGRIIEKQYGNEKISYDYNIVGDISQIKTGKFSVQFTYDDYGREVLREYKDGSSVEKKYDAAGRLTFIVHKDAYGKTLYGEGIVYGENGRIAYTVDKNGNFTHFEYDDRGRIKDVYYPYSERLENEDKSELISLGEICNTFSYEYISVPAKYRQTIVSLLDEMNTGASLSNSQKIWRRSFVYDANSNRIEKKSLLGSIKFIYDSENRLIKNNSINPVDYEYDANGNLIREVSCKKENVFEYDGDNRLIRLVQTDKERNSSVERKFSYDGLGRLVEVKDGTGNTIRYVYDGLSYDLLKVYASEKEYSVNSATKAYSGSDLRYVNASTYTASKQALSGKEKTETYAAGNDYVPVNEGGLYNGERNFVTVNGELCWQENDNEIYSFCVDQGGSVKSVLSGFGGSSYQYNFDIFGKFQVSSADEGSFVPESEVKKLGLSFAFAGKEFDEATGLYNFGQRFYDPENGRFITSDPVMDGRNWYVYCNNDPVNFKDSDGLEILNLEIKKKMQDYNMDFGNKEWRCSVSVSGCYLVTVYNIVKQLNRKQAPGLDKIANQQSYFNDKSELFGNKVAADYNLDYEAIDFSDNYERAAMVEKQINAYAQSNTFYGLAVKMAFGKPDGGFHYFGTDGKIYTDTEKDLKYLHVIGSSINDISGAKGRYNWIRIWNDNGYYDYYIPLNEVVGLRAYSIPNCGRPV